MKEINVAVIGSGLTGLETAAKLASLGRHRISLVEMQDKIGPGIFPAILNDELKRLSDTDFQVYEGTKRLTTYYPLEVYEEDFYSHPSVTVYDEYGQAYKIYQGSDGYWREEDGTTYVQLSDSEFQVKDGNKHVFTS